MTPPLVVDLFAGGGGAGTGVARANGLPDSQELAGTKAAQIARIGNMVCPDVAEALVRANVVGVRVAA